MIQVVDIFKRFGATTALDGVSFEVHPGEVFALVGHNGAGKTTAVRVVSGVLRPDSGEIQLAGVRGTAFKREDMARHVGIVSEHTQPYGRLTVYENLRFFAACYGSLPTDDRILHLIGLLQLEPYASIRVARLSHGNKQKVALARAVIGDPPILVLDEPMNGLDVAMQTAVRSFINLKRREGKAIILTSHVMGDIERLADRVAIIKGGKIVNEGTLPQLLQQSGAASLEDLLNQESDGAQSS